MAPSVLLLDHRDSFVWNLAQAFSALGCAVTVQRADRTTLDDVIATDADLLVLSPGPGHPRPDDVGVHAVQALSGQRKILGVCLGHQAITVAFGGQLVRESPWHGRVDAIRHDGSGLFHGLPDPLRAARYHSLVVPPGAVPAALRVCAHNDDGVVMAIAHRQHPTFGVQFHPESFLTEHGLALLGNFIEV